MHEETLKETYQKPAKIEFKNFMKNTFFMC